MQLMENYTFYAAVLLCIILPFVESVGIDGPFNPKEDMNVFNFPYNIVIVGAIGLTAVLGLLVTWSTFLVIDATSTLTYSVVCPFQPPYDTVVLFSCYAVDGSLKSLLNRIPRNISIIRSQRNICKWLGKS